MRLARLSLLAYGPFRGIELELGAPGLQVVFGKNEAGKSTTLRAIRGLLYGIDERTTDAHVHKMTELRIGAELIGADGTKLRVVRRKGKANTLLAPDGAAIPVRAEVTVSEEGPDVPADLLLHYDFDETSGNIVHGWSSCRTGKRGTRIMRLWRRWGMRLAFCRD